MGGLGAAGLELLTSRLEEEVAEVEPRAKCTAANAGPGGGSEGISGGGDEAFFEALYGVCGNRDAVVAALCAGRAAFARDALDDVLLAVVGGQGGEEGEGGEGRPDVEDDRT